jgi:hypothetical protein
MILKTIFNKIDADWVNIKNKCRTTIGKNYTENIPTIEFKRKLLISEHSPIRLLKIDWTWNNIYSWVATHWSRHKWECFIETQRSDRTGVDRKNLSQSELVKFDGEANAQHLIDSWRKRLCFMASPETRELAVDFKINIKPCESELSNVLVPNCIYRCGCCEFKSCGYWNKFISKHRNEDLTNIQSRYDLYNNDFYEVK